MICHEIEWSALLSSRVQIYLPSLVEFFCFAWQKMVSVSCIKVVFCGSDVCFRSVILVTFEGCLVDDWRLEAVSIKWVFVLLWAVACFTLNCVIFGVISVLTICLLWLLIICLVLFMQLQLILMVLQLNIFLTLWSLRECLFTSVRNLWPILVLLFLLNGGFFSS